VGWGDCSPHPADQGYVLGATHRRSWAGRDSWRQLGSQALLFARQRARTGNQGTICNRYPRGMSFPPAHNRSPPCIVNIQYTTYRVGALPPLTSGIMVAPALLAAVWCLTIATRLLAAASRVARNDRCTALQTHSIHAVSQSAPPAISACERRRDRTMVAWPNQCQPVAHNAPQTLSAFSSSIRANYPTDERRRPPNRQVERAASCARHRCLCVHGHVNCPRTHWCTYAARNNHMAFSLRAT
jgi:hypothetical protein